MRVSRAAMLRRNATKKLLIVHFNPLNSGLLTALGMTATAAILAAIPAGAQKPPAIRALGPIEKVSTEPLASVATAIALSDGRVYANDIVARRVLLFDPSLGTVKVVADSTSATAKAYGARPGGMFAFHGDSVLFADPASSSMLVLGPSGKIDRVMAIPRPSSGAPFLLNAAFGLPALDARGRLVALMPVAPPMPSSTPPPPGKRVVSPVPDSTFLASYDLTTRTFDTLTVLRTAKTKAIETRDEDGRLTALEMTPDLLPVIDDWAVRSDGVVAVVRGRDYHVDWRASNGTWSASPKMPYDWQHLDDGQKTTLIDSALASMKARRDSISAAIAKNGPPPIPAGDGGGRGGRGGGGAGGGGGPMAVFSDGRPGLGDLPDYRPPFTRGATRADADGNLWIRTNTFVKGQPVYDIVNSHGDLVDRVQLPPFRTIAGFGPGVVYMAVKDNAGVVHLERARIK